MNWEFAYPWVLLALLVLPPLAFWRFSPRLKKKHTGTFRFSGVSILADQKRGWRRYLAPLPDLLGLIALGLVIVALARPQSVEPAQVEIEGIEIYLALDMSGSMRAIDLSQGELRQLQSQGKDPLNRFEYAVATLKEFVMARDFDRIGMVVFAKNAFLQFPLTLDRRTIVSMLDRLELGDIDEGWTAIGNAIGRGVAGLEESKARTKIIILITDGDRRGGNISPRQATDIARELGIRIYPILVGKAGTTLVPAGRDPFSGREVYRETEFPVNPALLEEIAADTGGQYYRATDAEGLRGDLQDILDEFERSRIKDETSVDPDELFRPLVIWALLLLGLGFTLRNTILKKFP